MTLREEAKAMQDYLEITCSNNPEEIITRMLKLQVYMSRSGQLLAQTKRMLRQKKSSEISNIILKIAKEQFLSAKTQNALVDNIAEEENYMVDWLDRINRSATHQLDAMRSLLSYEKEQLKQNY